MSAEPKHLNPSDLPDDALDRLAFALVGRMQQYGVVVKPMRTKEAIRFCGFGATTFHKWKALGIIKEFRPDPNGDAVYFPDQITEGIKNYRQK